MSARGEYWVGLISDTHGLLREEALASLRGCKLILHAGDVGDERVLADLSGLAPVRAVRGNVDRGPLAARLPRTDVIELDGRQLYLLHDLSQLDLDPAASGFAAVISGHTHVPSLRELGGVIYINPGSAGPRRFDLPVSVGRLRSAAAGLRAELIELAEPGLTVRR